MEDISLCLHRCVHKENAEKAAASLPDVSVSNNTAEFFKVFGDPTRIKILYLIKEHELCVCDISYILDMSQSSISHQLSMLKRERIVRFRKAGKSVFYSLDDDHVRSILETGTEHITEYGEANKNG